MITQVNLKKPWRQAELQFSGLHENNLDIHSNKNHHFWSVKSSDGLRYFHGLVTFTLKRIVHNFNYVQFIFPNEGGNGVLWHLIFLVCI